MLKRIEEIDWEEAYAGKTVGPAGRYLPYDFETGEVGELESVTVKVKGQTNTYSAVVPIFRAGTRATLESCQA